MVVPEPFVTFEKSSESKGEMHSNCITSLSFLCLIPDFEVLLIGRKEYWILVLYLG